MHLSFETAWGVFRRMPEYTQVDLDALGVSQQDRDLTMGPAGWRLEHVPRVMRTLLALIYGSCEILRIPKITVPAEYIAPVVAATVWPSNQQLACIWLAQEKQTGVGALELAARAQAGQQLGPATADQLNALCILIMSTDGVDRYRERFANALGYEISKAMEAEATGKPAKRTGR